MADETNDQQQQAFNEKQIDGIKTLVGSIVNSAIASRDKMADKKRAEDRDAIKGEFAKILDEKLNMLAPPKKEEESEDKEPKDAKKRGEMAAMKAQMQAMQARLDESERDRQALLSRQRASALREGAARTLNAAGVVGDKFEIAYAFLVQSGRIRENEDSVSMDGVYNDPTLGDMPLDVGLSQWLKTDIAKTFLPPSGIRGSGSAPSRGGSSPSGAKPSVAEQRQLLAQRLVDELGK